MMAGMRSRRRCATFVLVPAAILVAAAGFAGEASDHRIHVSRGSVSASDPIVLTPEGARVELTPSFSMAATAFVADPYADRCRLVTVKYTLKKDDQKTILGDAYREPDPEDPLVLHAD